MVAKVTSLAEIHRAAHADRVRGFLTRFYVEKRVIPNIQLGEMSATGMVCGHVRPEASTFLAHRMAGKVVLAPQAGPYTLYFMEESRSGGSVSMRCRRADAPAEPGEDLLWMDELERVVAVHEANRVVDGRVNAISTSFAYPFFDNVYESDDRSGLGFRMLSMAQAIRRNAR